MKNPREMEDHEILSFLYQMHPDAPELAQELVRRSIERCREKANG